LIVIYAVLIGNCLHLFAGKCCNCEMNIASGDLCVTCTDKKECKHCRRRRDDHSFADANTCESCARRHRSAVKNTFQEVSVPMSSDFTTFETFLAHNSDTTSDIFSEALKEHRPVAYIYYHKAALNGTYFMILLR